MCFMSIIPLILGVQKRSLTVIDEPTLINIIKEMQGDLTKFLQYQLHQHNQLAHQ